MQPKYSTCSACLKAGLTHLILQLLVLRGDGFPDSNKASHCHAYRLTHPVYGCQGALRLLWLVFMVDQSGDLCGKKERGRKGYITVCVRRKLNCYHLINYL